MKLVVAGGTGFVGSEVVRQALLHDIITSLVVISRKPIALPADAPTPAKLKQVIVKDYGVYSEDAKKDLAGANACIW